MEMAKKTRILIICLIVAAAVGLLIFVLIIQPKLKQETQDQSLKDYQSAMKNMDLSKMNIILFTIDTLRADHLECYGYSKVKTPNINKLASEGIRFEHDNAQVPLTFPAHSSIFTGTYPLYHGMRDNGGFYLDESQITLAEVLKEAGYSTGAFIGAFVLDSRWGLDQGFDYYYDNFDLTKYKKISLDAVQRRGDEVLEEAYKWIEKNQDQKFFAWIHLYDPHTPYDPPEPYKTQFEGGRYSLYDGEIAYVDQLIGEFRDFMEQRKLFENTLIVVTGDHGESLGEHKESAHGFFIYDAAVHVPLILRYPEKKLGGRVISNQVKNIDIMPTVLDSTGHISPKSVQGQSLLPLILGKSEPEDEQPSYSETYWPRYHYGWSELKSLRKGSFKFIDAPKPELYNTLEDPGEQNNLINQKTSQAYQMKRELTALIEKYSAEGIEEAGPQKIDNDSLIKLQALGYIGSFRGSKKLQGEKLADPKDKIELYNEIKIAQFLVTEEKMAEAEQKINDVLDKDPSVLEARLILGNIYAKQNKYKEAIAEFSKALEVDPDFYDAIFGIAQAYKASGKTEEAIVGFKRLITLDPKDTKPFLHLGDIYEEKGQEDEAISYLESAADLDPEAPVFHSKLGALYLKKNMLDRAEQEIQKALSIERHIPLLNAHFNMALLHEARGEFELAVQEYKKEQKTSPFNYKPDFNLGLFYANRGEPDKAIPEFRSALEKNSEVASAYVFLAKACMDTGRDLNEAASQAQKGLSLKPDLKTAVFAHFVLADIYNRLGRYREAQEQANIAKDLQKSLSR